MPAKTKLGEKLLQWEDLRRQGKNVSVDELCRSEPELKQDLQFRVNALLAMDRALKSDPANEPQPLPAKIKIKTAYDEVRAGSEPVAGYKLGERLGKGGCGEVWKATGPGEFPVALKFVYLGGKLGRNENRSLEILKSLRHPNLISTFATWQIKGFLVIGMELADRTLYDRYRDAISQGVPGIPRDELLEYMREAARGIDYLNQAQHVIGGDKPVSLQHRDIKPQNILLVGGGIKVGDFGLIRVLQHSLTAHTGSMTLYYAAPEFFEGQTSQSSDQYSLAVTYCHLRGGRMPFMGSAAQIMRGHVEKRPDLSMLPKPERGPVLRALAKNPNERWPTCRELVEALRKSATVAQLPGVQLLDETTAVEATPVIRAEREMQPKAAVLLPSIKSLWWAVAQTTRKLSATVRKPTNRLTLIGVLTIGAVLLVVVPVVMFIVFGLSSNSPTPPMAPAQEITNSIGMRLRYMPPGKITMGSPKSAKLRSKDEYQHEVNITRGYYIGVYEVTQREYGAVMGTNPSWFSSTGKEKAKVKNLDTRSFPVDNVSWNEAVEFCNNLSNLLAEKKAGRVYRLPTEVEWEYACRGSARISDFIAIGFSPTQANFRSETTNLQRTTTVGSYPANSLGLYDLYGNVGEWCSDWYQPHYHVQSPQVDPKGPNIGSERLVRGGSFGSQKGLRSARWGVEPNAKSQYTGFRVVCELTARFERSNENRVGEVHQFKGHKDIVTSVTYSPNGRYAASASQDQTVKLWDVKKRHWIRDFKGHTTRINCVRFTPDGKHILTSGYDRRILLWDVETGKLVPHFRAKAAMHGHWIDISLDGKYILGSGADTDHTMQVRLLDSRGKKIRHFLPHPYGVSCGNFSADGKRLATACGIHVRLFDLRKNTPIREFKVHDKFVAGKKQVSRVAFSPSGMSLFAGGLDGRVFMWDIPSGRLERTFKCYEGAVTSMAVTPDGSRILTGGDRGLRLWDVITGQEIIGLEKHASPTKYLRISFQGF